MPDAVGGSSGSGCLTGDAHVGRDPHFPACVNRLCGSRSPACRDPAGFRGISCEQPSRVLARQTMDVFRHQSRVPFVICLLRIALFGVHWISTDPGSSVVGRLRLRISLGPPGPAPTMPGLPARLDESSSNRAVLADAPCVVRNGIDLCEGTRSATGSGDRDELLPHPALARLRPDVKWALLLAVDRAGSPVSPEHSFQFLQLSAASSPSRPALQIVKSELEPAPQSHSS